METDIEKVSFIIIMFFSAGLLAMCAGKEMARGNYGWTAFNLSGAIIIIFLTFSGLTYNQEKEARLSGPEFMILLHNAYLYGESNGQNQCLKGINRKEQWRKDSVYLQETVIKGYVRNQ